MSLKGGDVLEYVHETVLSVQSVVVEDSIVLLVSIDTRDLHDQSMILLH